MLGVSLHHQQTAILEGPSSRPTSTFMAWRHDERSFRANTETRDDFVFDIVVMLSYIHSSVIVPVEHDMVERGPEGALHLLLYFLKEGWIGMMYVHDLS